MAVVSLFEAFYTACMACVCIRRIVQRNYNYAHKRKPRHGFLYRLVVLRRGV